MLLTELGIPTAWALTFAFVFGTLIGSFLNVVIYRFHTGRSISGHSHCLSCGRQLRWFELFPVISYLVLRGRCRSCGSYVPPRYLLVEAATGVMFILGLSAADSPTELAIEWSLAALLVVVVVYDIYHLIIPNEFVWCLIGLAAVTLLLDQLAGGTLKYALIDVGAAVLASGFFVGLWYLSRGRWLGLGDAKLLFPLCLMVGAGSVFSLVVFSFWVGALISLLLVAGQKLLNRGKAGLGTGQAGLTIKSEVPFAPFIILSFILVHYGGFAVLELILYVYP